MPEDVLLTDYRGEGLSEDAQEWIIAASIYHAPSSKQQAAHRQVAAACGGMLDEILKQCPPSRDRTIALNKVREARMWANSAIATEGKV